MELLHENFAVYLTQEGIKYVNCLVPIIFRVQYLLALQLYMYRASSKYTEPESNSHPPYPHIPTPLHLLVAYVHYRAGYTLPAESNLVTQTHSVPYELLCQSVPYI